MPIKGRHLNTNIPVELEISSNQIQEAIIDTLRLILDSVKEILSKCPPEIATDILDNGIVLTGGGALIKNLDKYIMDSINIPVHIPEKPLESVVIGAGLAFDNKNILRTLLMKEI